LDRFMQQENAHPISLFFWEWRTSYVEEAI